MDDASRTSCIGRGETVSCEPESVMTAGRSEQASTAFELLPAASYGSRRAGSVPTLVTRDSSTPIDFEIESA
jgi:hypothetical protein